MAIHKLYEICLYILSYYYNVLYTIIRDILTLCGHVKVLNLGVNQLRNLLALGVQHKHIIVLCVCSSNINLLTNIIAALKPP